MLLLDEPFEGLAPALARRLGEVLANSKSEGISVLIAESNEVHVVLWVSQPIEIRSTPVAAIGGAVAGVMRPEASVIARPATIATALASVSGSILSRSTASTP